MLSHCLGRNWVDDPTTRQEKIKEADSSNSRPGSNNDGG